MAMQVDRLIVGADVAKAELVIHYDDRDEIVRLKIPSSKSGDG